jgi:integrase
MVRPRTAAPALQHHKPRHLAAVRLNGRYVYCGKWDTERDCPKPDALAKYHRVIAEYLAGQAIQTPPANGEPISMGMLCEAYSRHAQTYYRKNGTVTSEVERVASVSRVLLGLYAAEPADQFGPLRLKAVRQKLIDAGRVRRAINIDVGRVKRMIGWACENELIDPATYQRLLCVKGLRRGRGGRETQPRLPVPFDAVEAVHEHVGRQVWAMIMLQWHTGMRSGNACAITTGAIDRSGLVWLYTPGDHKMLGRWADGTGPLVIALGPQAQTVLATWLRADPDAPLFQPIEADAEFRAAKRDARKTPLWPSHERPKARRPMRKPGMMYTPGSYRRAIQRGCDDAGIDQWCPHQLRHAFATRAREAFSGDLDRVAAALGHQDTSATQVYAKLARSKADEVAAAIG